MIKVTRLDGREYYLNPHQIELIELKPDTTIVMLSGKQHIVRESISQVLESIETYRRRISPFINEE
ncbi:MAG: flagellar FlbD family protein [Treponema sp.]|jgi:flagellar protein FlbD|nr:flagellar FlbD family protein [Treponema sp.]